MKVEINERNRKKTTFCKREDYNRKKELIYREYEEDVKFVHRDIQTSHATKRFTRLSKEFKDRYTCV